MIQEKKGEYRPFTAQQFGELVKAFRLENGWKQITLAYEAGITERTVQRIESGEQVSDDTRRQIAKAFRLPDDFFTKPGYMPTTEEAEAMLAEAAEKFTVVDARPLHTPGDFEEILSVGHAFLIDGTALPDEMQQEVGTFKDAFHDWTWIFSDITHVDRLGACRSLLEDVHRIAGQLYHAVFAIYDADKPRNFRIAAITFVSKDREVVQLVVPRRFDQLQF